jgi:catechol 2,3-dioxygenase-like lactoylglutathione lyase family enzyme
VTPAATNLQQKDVVERQVCSYNKLNTDKYGKARKLGCGMDFEVTLPASTNQRGACEAGMKVRSLVPVLDVRDVEASIEFYCGVLGFTLQDKVEWGGKTEWALLYCDQVHLMLSASQHGDHEDAPSHQSDGMFFLYHDNLESLQVYLGSRGYSSVPDVLQAGQGKRDFYLRDPDGYVLWFSHKPVAEGDRVETR